MIMVNLRRVVAIAVAVSLAIGLVLAAPLWEKRDSKLIFCTEMGYAERLDRGEIKHRASPNVGGMGMYHYEITRPVPPGSKLPRTEIVHPTVALWTEHGRLLGSDRGEFGGELVLLDENASPPVSPTVLQKANIEDLFLMEFGVIATTGYFHLDQDIGSILLVTFSETGEPRAQEIFRLPAGVQSSWVMRDGRLLVNTSAGSFAISSPTNLEQVRCREHWWQII